MRNPDHYCDIILVSYLFYARPDLKVIPRRRVKTPLISRSVKPTGMTQGLESCAGNSLPKLLSFLSSGNATGH
jgi:hypothetical protein